MFRLTITAILFVIFLLMAYYMAESIYNQKIIIDELRIANNNLRETQENLINTINKLIDEYITQHWYDWQSYLEEYHNEY